MTRGATPAAEFATVFNWSPPRSRKLSLLSFTAASAALHALCFYVFQIIYPPTAALLPPPAHVNIITPASEEGRVLLRWIEAEDPALASTTQRPPHAAELVPTKPDYAPSYANRQPALKEIPAFEPDLRVPSSRPPAAVPLLQPATPVSAGVVPTSIRFSGAERFGDPEFPSLQFVASNNETPEAAQFRIALSSRGEVRYCFLQASSGDGSLDEQARRYLLLARFPTAPRTGREIQNELVWVNATVDWGSDIAVPPANPTAQRAP